MKSAQHAGYLHKKAQEWARQERIKHPLPKKKKVIIPLVLSLFLSACASTPDNFEANAWSVVYRADYSTGELVVYWAEGVDPYCGTYWEAHAEPGKVVETIFYSCRQHGIMGGNSMDWVIQAVNPPTVNVRIE